MPTDFQRLSRLLSLSAEARPITNIGNAGTDFDSSGGLTLAYNLILNASLLDHNPTALSGTPAIIGCWFDQAAQTFTDSVTAGSGTVAAMVFNAFQAPTLAATNALVTTTVVATVSIARPIAGINETFTTKAALWLEGNSIGATPADTLLLWNSTAAVAGAQQYSPAARLHGSGWKTDAVAGPQNVDYRIYLVPVQGAATPTANLLFDYSVNDGAFSNILTLYSGGDLFFTPTSSRIGLSTAHYLGFNAGGTDYFIKGGATMWSHDGTTWSVNKAIALTGGLVFKSTSATEIGYQITNGELTVGSEGSIEAPYLSQTGAAFSDAIGGNLDGCFGFNYDSDTGPTATLEARIEGAWLSMALTGIGVQKKVPYAPSSDVWVHSAQVYEDEGRMWQDETRCIVCGEQLRKGEPALPWVNAQNKINDLHAIFGHLHLEKDAYIASLETRLTALEVRP